MCSTLVIEAREVAEVVARLWGRGRRDADFWTD